MIIELTNRIFVSPQITVDDVASAAAAGVALIINNRPEGEEPNQPTSEAIAQAARTAGIAYIAIPVTHAGFDGRQIRAMVDAMASAQGPALAYCRSGTRSTFLWALAEASRGADPVEIDAAASAAGYDLAPVRHLIDKLADK